MQLSLYRYFRTVLPFAHRLKNFVDCICCPQPERLLSKINNNYFSIFSDFIYSNARFFVHFSSPILSIFLLLFFPFFFLIIPNQIVWLLEQNTKTTIKNVWPINKDNFPTNQWFCKSSDCDMIRVNLPKKTTFIHVFLNWWFAQNRTTSFKDVLIFAYIRVYFRTWFRPYSN